MFTLNCRGRLLVIEKPVVMGIINATPDSFYPGSRVHNIDLAVKTAAAMISDGASILDIGGQSTRPGSIAISQDEEAARVIPVIKALHAAFPGVIISIDTYYSDVASEAVKAGASIVNDISAGSIDEKMITTVAGLDVPYVLMHMPGTPQTMKDHAPYSDVTLDVIDFLRAKMELLKNAGIKDVIIDPGFGFGKNAAENFQLLNQLETFRIFERPLLLGISRKSFIYKTLETEPGNALNGTTVMNTVGLMNGASILRVHDVREAAEAVKLLTALNNKKGIMR